MQQGGARNVTKAKQHRARTYPCNTHHTVESFENDINPLISAIVSLAEGIFDETAHLHPSIPFKSCET
jgi:hypothetical protein